MSRAFGIDISKYQSSQDGSKKMDFTAVQNHTEEVTFIAARAGISWGYTDPMFRYYWDEMKRIKVMRIALPRAVFWRKCAGADGFTLQNAGWQGKFCSRPHRARPGSGRYQHAQQDYCHDPKVPGYLQGKDRFLSNCVLAGVVGKYLSLSGQFANSGLVAGNLSQNPALAFLYPGARRSAPTCQRVVSTYLNHQTGDKCKSIGGVSHYMDYNRWNGEKADVLRYFGNPTGMFFHPKTKFCSRRSAS